MTVRVIIAGGGTGGLATAIALRQAGIEPLVLEQAAAFTAIGAGLGLYANAMKALSYLGADGYWRQNAARIDAGESLVSPVRADLSGLPPLLVQAAEAEALFPVARRLADRAGAAGVPVTFSPVADSVHSFVLFDFLPETDRALAEFAAFARAAIAA